jgi:hypothetical protein
MSNIDPDSQPDSDRCHCHENFEEVQTSIALDRLPDFALTIRRSQQSPATSCTVQEGSLNGAFNIVYVLQFDDGVRWVLRVPGNGYQGRWDEIYAQALRSEALTMKLVARETTVPVPKVHHFEPGLENELGCPFILMDYIDGAQCHRAWFDRSADKDVLEQRRHRTLRDLAGAMMQLQRLTFPFGGALKFDEEGAVIGVGPVKVLDVAGDVVAVRKSGGDNEGMEEDNAQNKEDSGHDVEGANDQVMTEGPAQDACEEATDTAMSDHKGNDDINTFCEIGPFSSPKDFLLHRLHRRGPPSDPGGQATHKILEVLMDWVAEESVDPPFVLTHPDLAMQNVLVKEDGSLAGLIDWEDVCTFPLCLGNESFPSWLTRDWHWAHNYEKYPDRENSPEELARYRDLYVRYIREHSDDETTEKRTARSLLAHTLYNGTLGEMEPFMAVYKVVYECVRARNAVEVSQGEEQVSEEELEEEVNLEFKILAHDTAQEDFHPSSLGAFREGFDALCAELDRVGE